MPRILSGEGCLMRVNVKVARKCERLTRSGSKKTAKSSSDAKGKWGGGEEWGKKARNNKYNLVRHQSKCVCPASRIWICNGVAAAVADANTVRVASSRRQMCSAKSWSYTRGLIYNLGLLLCSHKAGKHYIQIHFLPHTYAMRARYHINLDSCIFYWFKQIHGAERLKAEWQS